MKLSKYCYLKAGLLVGLLLVAFAGQSQDCLDTAETDCEVVKCVNSLIKQKMANKEAIKANPHDLMHFYLSVDVMKRGVEYGSESVKGCEAEWNKLLENSNLALDLLVNDGDYFLARFVKAYLLENESPPNYNAALKCLMWIESKMFKFKREHFKYFEEEEGWRLSDLEIILVSAKIMADYRQMNIFYQSNKNSTAYEDDTTPDLLFENIIALDKLIYGKQKGKDYNLGLFHSTSLKHLGLYWGDILLEAPDFLARVYFSGLLGVPKDREKAAKLAMILVKHYPSNSNALTLAYNITNHLVEEGYAYADVLHFQVSYHMYSFFKNSLKEDYVRRLENTLYGFEVRGNKSIADYMQKYNGQGPAHKVFQDRQSLEMDIALKKKDMYRVYCEGAGITGDPFYDGYGKPPHLMNSNSNQTSLKNYYVYTVNKTTKRFYYCNKAFQVHPSEADRLKVNWVNFNLERGVMGIGNFADAQISAAFASEKEALEALSELRKAYERDGYTSSFLFFEN